MNDCVDMVSRKTTSFYGSNKAVILSTIEEIFRDTRYMHANVIDYTHRVKQCLVLSLTLRANDF